MKAQVITNNKTEMDIAMSMTVCAANAMINSNDPISEPEMVRGVFGDKLK